jgi:peptide/nickel transport system permease protein
MLGGDLVGTLDAVPVEPAQLHGDRSTWLVGVGGIAVGIGMILAGTIALDHATAWPRWLLGVAGAGAVLKASDVLGKGLISPSFHTGYWASVVWVGGILIVALIANVLPLESPTALPLNGHPYVRPDLFSGHPLGTDQFGRDELSRALYAARVSLLIGVGCTVVGGVVGSTIGIGAGYFRGRLDAMVRVGTDTLLAFPPLIFLVVLVAAMRPSLSTEFVALSVLTVPTFVRLSRANAYSLREREYVLAARAIGARNRRVILHEVVPNILEPLLSYATVIVAALIVAEASLSFLGLGIQPPNPSWGNMIAQADNNIQQTPHGVVVPAAFLFLTVLAFNRLGEAGRRRRESRESVL